MVKFKRNDKVCVLYPQKLRRKMSDEVELLVGKPYIIKQMIPRDEFDNEDWVRIYGPITREFRYKNSKIDMDYVGIQLEVLFKYTRLGELLYG